MPHLVVGNALICAADVPCLVRLLWLEKWQPSPSLSRQTGSSSGGEGRFFGRNRSTLEHGSQHRRDVVLAPGARQVFYEIRSRTALCGYVPYRLGLRNQ